MLRQLGLRTIACSRYSFGFWGAKLASVLNVVIGGGFYVVNLVVVGQILRAVSDYTMSIVVGIIIVSIVSYLLSVFGFRIIHTYEKYSWIITFILLLVLVGQVAPHVHPDISGFDPGLSGAGAFLTMAATTFSNASGWCSIASDYTPHYSKYVSSVKIFILATTGVFIPVTFSIIVGICLGNAAITAPTADPSLNVAYANAYGSNSNLGGLLLEAYHPTGFAKFAAIILTFSVLGNNIAINYSSGLSMQLLGHYFHAVPRFIWSLIFAIVVAVLAIAGQSSLSAIVEDFVALLGYWTVSFTLILALEHGIWRRRKLHDPTDPSSGYDLHVWDTPEKLPWGVSAVMALLSGYLAGGVPGMAQTWYVGPIAAKFGTYGGDVGVPLSAAITLLVYPTLRYFERKYTGR